MNNPIKRLARWVLRKELREDLIVLEDQGTELRNTRARLRALELQHSRQAQRFQTSREQCRSMEPWVRKNRPGDTTFLAWAQYIVDGPAGCATMGHGNVHPFARWGISPTPEEFSRDNDL